MIHLLIFTFYHIEKSLLPRSTQSIPTAILASRPVSYTHLDVYKRQVLQQLRVYYQSYKPQVYLFNGYKNGCRFSPRSIQHVLHTALIKSGLADKGYSIHTLRHSFATHLVDNGADLQIIQELMGHSHLNQTVQYLHLSTKRLQQTTNPYDILLSQINNTPNQTK